MEFCVFSIPRFGIWVLLDYYAEYCDACVYYERVGTLQVSGVVGIADLGLGLFCSVFELYDLGAELIAAVC